MQFFSKHSHCKYIGIKFSQLYKFIKLLFLFILPSKKRLEKATVAIKNLHTRINDNTETMKENRKIVTFVIEKQKLILCSHMYTLVKAG